MLIIVGDDIHAAALAVARKSGTKKAGASGKLYAPLDDDAEDWLNRIWDATEAALLGARNKGKAAAAELIKRATDLATEAAKALKQRYDAVKARIAQKLNDYVQAVIDGALARIRPTLSVGGRDLPVVKVTMEQRLMISGSVKASLEEVCEFVAEGELTLSAEYGTD